MSNLEAITHHFTHYKKGLVIVDMQNDFMPIKKSVSKFTHSRHCNDYTGCQSDCGSEKVEEIVSALPVPGGLDIVPNIVKEAIEGYEVVIATRDFHPPAHVSFKEVGGTWPMHCVAGSEGAQLLPEIDMIADVILSKGTDPEKEAYSGFEGTKLGVLLHQHLRNNVDELVIVGVATDYCVHATAMDAKNKYGFFNTTVLLDCIAGVDQETTDAALIDMDDAGIKLMTRAQHA